MFLFYEKILSYVLQIFTVVLGKGMIVRLVGKCIGYHLAMPLSLPYHTP